MYQLLAQQSSQFLGSEYFKWILGGIALLLLLFVLWFLKWRSALQAFVRNIDTRHDDSSRDRNEIIEFRKVLAALYRDEASIRRVVDDIGIDPSTISFTSKSIDTWHSILTEVTNQNKIQKLLAIVDGEYSQNQKYQAASAPFRQLVNRPVCL